MAKIRVYELARALNMKNKVLLEKIGELDIEVASHMSSLDEAAAERIKAHVLGTKTDVVEETRVKPTVIRRRRKVVRKEPAPVEAEAEAEVQDEPGTVAEAPVDGKDAEPETAVAAAAEENTDEATAAAEDEAAAQTADAAGAAEAENASEPADVSAEAGSARKKAAPKKTKKAAKKKKTDEPAKIIKLGEVKKTPEPAAAEPSAESAEIIDLAAPTRPAEDAGSRDKKKKGGKRKVDPDQTDKRFLKKKISFRRKEVVEGADLYSRPMRGKKGRKMAKGRGTSIGQKTEITTAKAIKRRIKIDEAIMLSELAKRMGIKANEMIAKLMGLGVMATVNQTIDFDTAVLVAAEFGYEIEKAAFEEESLIRTEVDDPEKLMPRPPVVTIMGHVDHGKTSLLDVIRKSKITDVEAGGITQHIGAYHVSTEKGQIVFLDTPGHEAFTAMRSRGAQVTDIVVLVVAADDGVMPQTVEAINHAKAAGVPLIVAVNKIDKANAEPDRVQRQLSELGLTPEDWGGDTIFVQVSAKQNIGIDDLLEMILLQSEILELKANPDKLAKGHVVEAKLESGRGAVATVLVQEGTLKAGDPVVCGVHHGKIRALLNDRGKPVDTAGPSMPVEILGLAGVPNAGDEFVALADEKDAKQVSEHRTQKQRSKELAKTSRMSLESLFEKMKDGEVKDLNLIIKADVHGSIEAINDALVKLSNEEVKINVVHSATGTISESDVSLAAVSDAIIIGFNVRPNAKVQTLAQEEHVDMRFYNIIYNVIKDVQDAILGMMSSTYEEHVLGTAEIRQVFHIPKIGAVAGCYVTEGKIVRGNQLRLIRDGVVVYEGKNTSLRRYKDDVKEVQSGYECGIGIEKYNDLKVGDTIECFYMEEIKPKLD